MLIRAMTASDAASVAQLAGQLGYPTSVAEAEQRFAALAADPDHGLYVAEAADGRVTGWVHVHGRRLLEAEPFAEIGGLVVDAECRGQGVGRALMAEAERWAAGRGYCEVCVRSNALRAAAHRFYGGLGYAPVKAQQVFRRSVL